MAKTRKPPAKVRRFLSYTARVADVIEVPEGDVVNIYLAERRSGGPRLIISRAFEAGNPPDYTLHDERGAWCTRGISRWSFEAGVLELRLAPAAAKKLRYNGYTITVPARRIDRIGKALARLLAKR